MRAQANGLLSRDGNPHTLTGALVEFPSFSDALDDVRTSNDTRVTIDNNAAAISALAGLNEASGSWDQCLQVRHCCYAWCTGQDCTVVWLRSCPVQAAPAQPHWRSMMSQSQRCLHAMLLTVSQKSGSYQTVLHRFATAWCVNIAQFDQ